jgi:hypothetical protein
MFSRWRPDGKELFYLTSTTNGVLMSVEVKAGSSAFEYGAAKPLFESKYENYTHGSNGGNWHAYAVTRNGERFLIPRAVELNSDNSAASFLVLMNWPSLLK